MLLLSHKGRSNAVLESVCDRVKISNHSQPTTSVPARGISFVLRSKNCSTVTTFGLRIARAVDKQFDTAAITNHNQHGILWMGSTVDKHHVSLTPSSKRNLFAMKGEGERPLAIDLSKFSDLGFLCWPAGRYRLVEYSDSNDRKGHFRGTALSD